MASIEDRPFSDRFGISDKFEDEETTTNPIVRYEPGEDVIPILYDAFFNIIVQKKCLSKISVLAIVLSLHVQKWKILTGAFRNILKFS